jgi:hypothetical protein
MTLRCASCGRSLKAFAWSVQTSRGTVGYGPVCATRVQRAMDSQIRKRGDGRFGFEGRALHAHRGAHAQEGQLALEFA